MTFIDDNMLGTGPARSAKSGSKSHDMVAARQLSAFEDAFADAGKKKQPVVSISGKPAADARIQLNSVVSQTPGDVPLPEGAADRPELADGDDGQVFPRKAVSEDEISAEPAVAIKTVPAKDPTAGELPLMRSESKRGLLPSISLAALAAEATTDAGNTVDAAVSEKVASLLKDPKVQISKPQRPEGDPEANSLGDAPAADDVVQADVNQLLTLLGAPPTAVAATPQAQTTPAMSEFQGLAERAGKSKAVQKDANATDPEGRAEGDEHAVRNATQAGADQIFRFARADGKGQAVSMSRTADGDKTTVTNDAPQAGAATAKTETVTVVEARRYLGLAPASNASAVISQIAGNPEWARSLQPSEADSAPLTQASTGKVLNTLKIQMHPIDLGTVTATLRLKDDELHVELKVETGDAFRQLSDDQNAMVKALRAQGFAVDQVSIVFNAPDSSDGSPQQQAQQQTGQQGRETAGDGTAQGKGQRNDDTGQQGRGRWTGNEGTGDASSGAELNRAGDVYM